MHNITKEYIKQMVEIINDFPLNNLSDFINCIGKAYEENRTIFVIGNGGSASTASHFAADLNKNVIFTGRRPRVIALTDQIGSITAWGNDTEYTNIFVEQLKNFYNQGDLVIALSGSGKSPNVLKAIKWAKIHSATIVGLTGIQGLPLKELSDVCIMVPSNKMEQIEDFHLVCMHAMIVSIREKYGKISSEIREEIKY